jgi:hypothetical protein
MRPAVPSNPLNTGIERAYRRPHPHLPLHQTRSLSTLQFFIDILGTIAQHWSGKRETESPCQIIVIKQGG